MPNWFNRKLALPKVKHSNFDLSFDLKSSLRIGFLNPVGYEEILPSDRLLQHNTEVFIRFAPLKYPLMHRIKVHTSRYFIPFRIVMGEELYRKFLNNEIEIQPVDFRIESSDSNPFVNSLLDYLEYDVQGAHSDGGDWIFRIINPLPFYAYLITVRDWYLDSNLQSTDIAVINTIVDQYRVALESGLPLVWDNDQIDKLGLFNVAYTKDYFNTARPQPQNGEEMFVLNRPNHYDGLDGKVTGVLLNTQGNLQMSDSPYSLVNESTTIKDLWRKEMLQRFFETDNVFGSSRIREKLGGHYGVDYSDKRIEIPLMCGGSSTTVQISEVISQSTSGDGLGVFGGKGVVSGFDRSRKIYFEEHGIYMSFLSLVPDNGYCRGEHRFLLKRNIFDIAFPEFNNIGWQDVYKGELFVDQDNGEDPFETWGYQSRYSEYRSHPSRCTGAFRNQPEELAWHLNRNFDSVPPLNGDFLKVADVNRIFNQQDLTEADAPLYVDVYHKCEMSRPISYEPDSMHLY